MAMTLLESGKQIKKKWYLSHTGGHVIAKINNPPISTDMCSAWASLSKNNIWFSSLGGSTGSFGVDWAKTMLPNPSTFSLYIEKGETFGIRASNSKSNQKDVDIEFYFVPNPSKEGATAPVIEETSEPSGSKLAPDIHQL